MILVDVLLFAGIGLVLFAVLGTVVMGDALDRLHFSAPVGLGALLVAIAVLLREGFSLIGDKALLLAALVLVTAPLLSHLTARAAVLREDRRGPRR